MIVNPSFWCFISSLNFNSLNFGFLRRPYKATREKRWNSKWGPRWRRNSDEVRATRRLSDKLDRRRRELLGTHWWTFSFRVELVSLCYNITHEKKSNWLLLLIGNDIALPMTWMLNLRMVAIFPKRPTMPLVGKNTYQKNNPLRIES